MVSDIGHSDRRLDVPALDGARVLLVEDDAALRRVVSRGLQAHGVRVQAAADGRAAMAAVERDAAGHSAGGGFDAYVIDIGLPDADGRDVCQALRARGVAGPVVFLTAMGQTGDIVSGFAAGADDYIAKPFQFPVLLVRLDALLRRAAPQAAPPPSTREVPREAAEAEPRLDPLTHALTAGDRSVSLTPTEYRVLAALVAAPERVIRRGELVRSAWPDGAIVHDNTLDQYIARLRRKLAAVTSEHTLSTAHGVGYRYT